MATRIQSKSRPTKRPMQKGNYSAGGGTFTQTGLPGRKPKTDKKGFPDYKGLPAPVLVGVTVVA